MKGFIKVLANHVWGIVCVVGTVCGIPFFYNLISGFDLNTDIARTLITVVGVLISGVSFALGWNQRNMSVRREISEIENGHAEVLKCKQAALDNEKRKNAKLAAILDERKRQEREQAQRDEDADRLLKLTMAEYKVIDGILVAAAQSKEYRRSYNTAIGDLYSQGVIESLDDGKTYVIRMKLRPFFEKYANAIHEVAEGTNDDRLRISRLVRDGKYFRADMEAHKE
ncbi:MAG: hypothetical protein IKE22_07560 [Atopobiaceae bacterium]|nr:hypothetical protein [Atopobiaceae bacterium]